MLKLENVHTYYGNSHILQGVSFEIPKGKCVALLGRNGAGKTTTIHSIAGLTPPRKGSIRYGDKEILGEAPYRIAKLGFGLVPQGRRIFPSLTIRENLTMPARKPQNSGDTKLDPWTLEKVYELFPVLQERETNMGNQLSGGQQQMLAIGRALMTNPHFLLMDEPSEGLAPVIIGQVGEIIRTLKQKGLSILLVEQNFFLACGVADEVMVMNKGQIVWQGSPKELLADNDIQHRYLGV
ncbi:ABC transporter ATP-binding protein [Paenibacillus validus]|uniref:ATP-binding cassette domain-containing protein n=1 Tax=Paenibacillus validus TaxID=44253 RepID=A0A7X2Z6H0_9BACL|nr:MULTISPECIES: ABC transporter ATP-binding protein [Paenibacillus]MED4601223.1 ABC transporter ATP-binding protein [Paenibacillus validus]MED4606894.1 ABC transporter ATP-binding protein [Paenibacillus validus]MUG69240.1 ATP-binding cassette domain-containing protein [Paenibacillus validus]